MCGINALVSIQRAASSSAGSGDTLQSVEAGIEAIAHRGPDGRGSWISQDGSVALGHCRLAIIGPDKRGLQPFNEVGPCLKTDCHSSTSSKHVFAVVNGEFYDYERIKESLQDEYDFHSDSDSEILIALYLKYGLAETLHHLRGEFAFILYDERIGKLWAVRDRYGIKPLYYGLTQDGSQLAFCSEVKGLLAMGCRPRWDIESIANEGYRNSNRTLFRDINWMEVGSLIEWNAKTGDTAHRHWYVPQWPLKTISDHRPVGELITGLRERLVEAVRLRLRSDVPVGVYLSGGVDSSSIAGIISHLIKTGQVPGSHKPIHEKFKCFSIGFDHEQSESGIAKRTAEFVGAQFLPLEVNEALLCQHYEDAIAHCELPYADLGFVAKYLLSRLARENGVKVVITGEGSDESFGGYHIFKWDRFAERDASRQPQEDPQPSAEDLVYNLTSFWGIPTRDFTPEEQSKYPIARNPIVKLLAISHHDGHEDWVEEKYSSMDTRLKMLSDIIPPESLEAIKKGDWHTLHSSLLLFTQSLFPTQLLTHLGDRTEMAHSLEARTPFLDHHLTEYINSIPPAYKSKWQAEKGSLREKWILYEAVRPFITDEVYNRVKQPFIAARPRKRSDPFYALLSKWLTPEKISRISWLNVDKCQALLKEAYPEKGHPATEESDDDENTKAHKARRRRLAINKCSLIIQLLILQDKWGVETHPDDEIQK
ncbi:unnamed protein product [Sympodiomycopsis kandeliae]